MAGPGRDPGFEKTPAGKIRAIDHPARLGELGVPGPVEGAPGPTRGLTRLFCHRQGGCFNPRLTCREGASSGPEPLLGPWVNNMDLFRDSKGYNPWDSRRGILKCLDRKRMFRC